MTRYTDEALRAAQATGGAAAPCHARQAEALLTVPEHVRDEMMSEAHTLMNYIGGNLSGAIYAAAAEWARSGRFPFRERAAAHREREREMSAQVGRRVILPM